MNTIVIFLKSSLPTFPPSSNYHPFLIFIYLRTPLPSSIICLSLPPFISYQSLLSIISDSLPLILPSFLTHFFFPLFFLTLHLSFPLPHFLPIVFHSFFHSPYPCSTSLCLSPAFHFLPSSLSSLFATSSSRLFSHCTLPSKRNHTNTIHIFTIALLNFCFASM